MANELKAREIFKRGYFASYSEFYLALAMGSVLKNRGYCLNMDNMQVDVDAVPQDMVKYYKRLLSDGAITMSMYERKEYTDEIADSDTDTSYFDKVILVEEGKETLDWTIDFARENYGEYSKVFLELLKIGNNLMHLVANHLVNHILDGENRKLVIHFDSAKAKSTFLYVNIYSILQTMVWVKDLVELDVDFGDFCVDLDYSIFCNNGRVAGRYKMHTVADKLKVMEKYGMVVGSILILWERSGMCDNNEYGHITGAKLFRLDEIGDDFLGVTTIAVNKTKEEVKLDYYDIDESIRYLFVDMLDKKPFMQSTELSVYDTGIDNYFYDEAKYITLLDESEEVFKTVTIDGQVTNVKMKGVDAIYWLLCQYDIEFDRDLYKSMYFHGDSEPLWDMYN